MAREYFCAYHSFLESLTPYGDAEVGRLFRSCLKYSMTGEEPALGGNERFIWPTLKAQIDRDKAAYASTCATNRENGGKGGRPPKKPDGYLENRAVFEETEKTQGEEKEEDKGEEEGKDEGEVSVCARARSAAEDAFETFWTAYPKKVGKQAAFKSFLKVSAADRRLLIPAIEMQMQSRQWQREGGRFIPNPATWLNQGRWMDEATVTKAPASREAQELEESYSMMRRWADAHR